jgi:hypothetical protein
LSLFDRDESHQSLFDLNSAIGGDDEDDSDEAGLGKQAYPLIEVQEEDEEEIPVGTLFGNVKVAKRSILKFESPYCLTDCKVVSIKTMLLK